MELSDEDLHRLRSSDKVNEEFYIIGRDGIPRLRNRGRYCVFYDRSKKGCRIYHIRPLGCSIYPVNVTEQDVLVIDGICPEGGTIGEEELGEKGRTLRPLLRKIDEEAAHRSERAGTPGVTSGQEDS